MAPLAPPGSATGLRRVLESVMLPHLDNCHRLTLRFLHFFYFFEGLNLFEDQKPSVALVWAKSSQKSFAPVTH
jgi:hypothetical protein